MTEAGQHVLIQRAKSATARKLRENAVKTEGHLQQ